jgi:hypothetical protein
MRALPVLGLLLALSAPTRATEPARPWYAGHRVLFNGVCTLLFYDAFAPVPKG